MKENNLEGEHTIFMRRCLELARNGKGHVAPNPMVGAVLVFENMVIGEGYHENYGSAHAEVNAINAVKNKSLLPKSTLYVSLEPCTHYGKTPPCTDLIVSSGIPKIVIGTLDPNSKVAGKGIKRLKKEGLDVTTNVLEKECRELNKCFFTFHEKKRPYVILKWAQTADGFIDFKRAPHEPIGVHWITNPISQTVVHKWRAEEQSIMVGTETVLTDNPKLNVRHWPGKSPLRLVLDKTLRIPAWFSVLDNSQPTIVFNTLRAGTQENTEYVLIKNWGENLKHIMKILYEKEVLSVIVEGGKALHESFVVNNLCDEVRVFIGDKTFGDGLLAPKINYPLTSEGVLGRDRILIYKNLTG